MALDTTNILGRGAVKDTCNLLADGIVQLLRTLAAVEKSSVKEWGKARGYEGYLGSSVRLERQTGAGACGRDCERRGPVVGAVAAGQGELPVRSANCGCWGRSRTWNG